ncbi:LOW QUALITY PROTEIN: myricetin 3-O-rhamnoside 1,2-glucosyltransferase UGT709G2-like [Dioscorea cayenensis subsp. rotundata]|uniref:Glycosyltransferase n=1 Tax=Dioscorea cayennensis subsp. rotundata TaxID=55577 RepID=A0AB40C1D8_DIOCR|nr:LOW QUALITY PROTEIN: myricetin 3-O-rhamnoside 1,2-glucosyltransferase UGT709G2-like [Dioscorea cayenensis subsp. rotundata]
MDKNTSSSSSSAAAHVLIIPFPAQGHVTPMLSLAKLISFSGVFTTFVNTESIHRRLSGSGRIDGRRLRFRAVPDLLTDDGGNERDFDFPSMFFNLQESMRRGSTETYKKLLTEEFIGEWPPVTCVIADGVLDFAIEVAGEVGIPTLVFRTSSPCCAWTYATIPSLINNGIIPFPEECDMDEIVKGVEGMEGIMRRRDLPSFMRMVKSTEDNHIKLMNGFNSNLVSGKVIIFNSFDALDPTLLPIMSSYWPPIFTIGPLHLLTKFWVKNSCSSSLRQEDRTCMTWLDNQPDKSVIYVSFGTVAVMSPEQYIEFWHGLVNSGHRFLWAVREDMVKGKQEMEVTKEMEEETKKRGCMVEWVPQEEVLAHRAVGCFLTHCGWNSTLEGMVAGVPMICWPYFSDQMINSRFVSDVWRIGLDMKDVCDRNIVERMVREVMEGESALELRSSAARMADLARKSIDENGTSRANFESLVSYIKSAELPRGS